MDSSLNMDGTGGADAMRAAVGTADIGNFSVGNVMNAFKGVPPNWPTCGLAMLRWYNALQYDGYMT